jgi:hypothetical protein
MVLTWAKGTRPQFLRMTAIAKKPAIAAAAPS